VGLLGRAYNGAPQNGSARTRKQSLHVPHPRGARSGSISPGADDGYNSPGFSASPGEHGSFYEKATILRILKVNRPADDLRPSVLMGLRVERPGCDKRCRETQFVRALPFHSTIPGPARQTGEQEHITHHTT